MLIRLSDSARLFHADCRDAIKSLPDNSIDSVVTDPPYALVSIVKRFGKPGSAPAKGNDAYMRASAGFMGKQWDTGEVAFSEEFWSEVLRVLKPGGHVAAFGASRGYHRMACAIEDAGFEIRDSLMWVYATGFPKSHDVSKGIDKAAGAKREVVGINEDWVRRKPNGSASENSVGFSKETDYNIYAPATDAARQWEGWGTALKPAFEPIVLARKPLSESTVAANVLRWGTGALNIDGCRVPAEVATGWGGKGAGGNTWNETNNGLGKDGEARPVDGRWPANVVLDGSDEVVGAFPTTDKPNGRPNCAGKDYELKNRQIYGQDSAQRYSGGYMDAGSAARFFFNAAESDDQWLARNLPRNHAKPAGRCFSLQSELAVSVLRNAADLSTLRLEPKITGSLEAFMNVTPSELRLISDTLTEMMQSFERRPSLDLLQERLSLSGNPASFVATKEQTGIIMITISPSKFGGCVERVTFSITPTNLVHGVKDCAQSTSRFHYSAKASRADRNGSKHPTVKPIALMEWLATLITPPGGTILDPFAGSGTTGAAARNKGFNVILCEREDEYVRDICGRFGARPDPLARLLRWNAAVTAYRAAHV